MNCYANRMDGNNFENDDKYTEESLFSNFTKESLLSNFTEELLLLSDNDKLIGCKKENQLSEDEEYFSDHKKKLNRLEVDSETRNLKYRDKFTNLTCGLLIVWVSMIFFFMYWLFSVDKISDQVMITFLSTTTGSIIAMPLIILKSLFPPEGKVKVSKKV